MKDTMSEAPESTTESGQENGLHPALQFLQKNLLLIGVIALVVVALAVVILKPGTSPAAAPAPSITATAGAATPAPTKAPSASTSPTAEPATTKSPTASTPATTQTAAPTPAATEAPLIGNNPQSVEVENWRPYAEKFAQAFANTTGGKEAWLARLRPLVTDSLYSGFKATDMSRVTSRTFKTVNTMDEENAYSTFVAVYADGSAIEGLIQVQNDGTWRVHKTAKHEV